jgi:septal ring factor EnvC (AmiA/AmiB activator)
MARCPSCGAVVRTPAKAWTYLEWDRDKTSLVKKDVGVFECPSCRTRFPAVAGREAVLIIPVQKVQSLKAAAEEAHALIEKLKAELAQKEDQNATLRENIAMLELQIKALHLEHEVGRLREEKAKLEEGIVALA